MKKALFIASLGFLSAGWAIELNPGAVIAETQFVVAQQPASGAREPSPSSKPPQIELLYPGVEPRQQLRFKPAINAKDKTVMTVKIDTKMLFGGQLLGSIKVPTSVMTFETKVTQIDANGDIHYELAYTDADISIDTANIPAVTIDSVRSLLKKMVGVKGSFIMDNRRFHKGGGFILPEQANSKFKQLFEQRSQPLQQVLSPLPAEAVGKGAKWRVSSVLYFIDTNVNNFITYELTDLQDGAIAINVSIEEQITPKNSTSPELPASSNLTVKSFASKGQGEVTGRLDRLMPFRYTKSTSSKSKMSVKKPGSSEESTITMEMDVYMNLDAK